MSDAPSPGQGLRSLIPGPQDRRVGASLVELPVSTIVPNAYQPRSVFDQAALESLASSIKEVGVLQPLLVREHAPGQYELIAGERRWRAAQLAGLDTVPVVVRPVSDQISLEQAIVENVQREELHPLEEALAFQQLIDDFGLTQEQIAARVGKSRPSVANTLRLLQLPGPVQKLIAHGHLGAGHGRALLALSTGEAQEKLARRAVAQQLSVRQVEDACRRPSISDLVAPPPTHGRAPQHAQGSAEGSAAGLTGLLEAQSLLEDHLQTSVQVTTQQSGRCKIVVDAADAADLTRLVGLLLAVDGSGESVVVDMSESDHGS